MFAPSEQVITLFFLFVSWEIVERKHSLLSSCILGKSGQLLQVIFTPQTWHISKFGEKKVLIVSLYISGRRGIYCFFFSHLTVTVKERLFASSRAKATSWVLERYVFLTLWREKFFQKWSSKKEDCNNLYSVYHIYLIVCLFS